MPIMLGVSRINFIHLPLFQFKARELRRCDSDLLEGLYTAMDLQYSSSDLVDGAFLF